MHPRVKFIERTRAGLALRLSASATADIKEKPHAFKVKLKFHCFLFSAAFLRQAGRYKKGKFKTISR